MFKRLRRWLSWWRTPAAPRAAELAAPQTAPPPPATPLPRTASESRIEQVILTDEVARSLFEDFAAHRDTERGDEEIGWMVLGLRDGAEVKVIATLPAGMRRDSGVAHVLFNSDVQAIGSFIVRQFDRRLMTLGMVHTHPGSLRHPSDGDYRGDIEWVRYRQGNQAVFGIGTADARDETPAAHQQIHGELCFSWFVLHEDDSSYRRLPVTVTPGRNLARPLHAVWETLEQFAVPLQRLALQLSGLVIEAIQGTVVVTVELAEKGQCLRIVLQNDEARYYVEQGSQVSAVDPEEPSLERAVYLILAELAKPAAEAASYSAHR